MDRLYPGIQRDIKLTKHFNLAKVAAYPYALADVSLAQYLKPSVNVEKMLIWTFKDADLHKDSSGAHP